MWALSFFVFGSVSLLKPLMNPEANNQPICVHKQWLTISTGSEKLKWTHTWTTRHLSWRQTSLHDILICHFCSCALSLSLSISSQFQWTLISVMLDWLSFYFWSFNIIGKEKRLAEIQWLTSHNQICLAQFNFDNI